RMGKRPRPRAERSLAKYAAGLPRRSANRRSLHVLDVVVGRPRRSDRPRRLDRAHALGAPRRLSGGRAALGQDAYEVRHEVKADPQNRWLENDRRRRNGAGRKADHVQASRRRRDERRYSLLRGTYEGRATNSPLVFFRNGCQPPSRLRYRVTPTA